MYMTLGALAAAALLVGSAPVLAQAAGPSDAQIAHIAYTAGLIDVDAGKQALERSHNADVRAFAQTMVRDHTAVNDKALALVKQLKVTPQDNPTSQALATQAKATDAQLGALNGAAFDRAYVTNEVAFHQTVIDALDKTLIPDADNAELKALLTSGRSLFGEHLKHAEHLAQQLR